MFTSLAGSHGTWRPGHELRAEEMRGASRSEMGVWAREAEGQRDTLGMCKKEIKVGSWSEFSKHRR